MAVGNQIICMTLSCKCIAKEADALIVLVRVVRVSRGLVAVTTAVAAGTCKSWRTQEQHAMA